MRATPKAVASVAVALAAVVGVVFAGVAGGVDGDGAGGGEHGAGEQDGVDGTGEQGGGNDDSAITITYEARNPQSDACAKRADALSMSREDAEDTYSFIITLSSDLCTPLETKAAAYAMPDDKSWPWPQTLLEVEEFTLSEAGVTTVSFDKACDPIQFDVLTGVTPELIDPFGAHHGPLLVPHTDPDASNGSAYQYWPGSDDCTDGTTTTSAPEGSSTTTSEPPVTVESATTIRDSSDADGGLDADSNNPPATVGGAVASRSPAALSISG